jgi:murein DD-endopeptidase MepM/ murein hydrolase activator NlpD
MATSLSVIGKTVLATALATSAAWAAVVMTRSGAESEPRTSAPPPPADFSPTRSIYADKAATRAAAPPARPADPISPQLIVPVGGVGVGQLVDTFRESRSEGRVHDAIDIMAPRGTSVVAVAPGRIEKLFNSARGGLTIYQRSQDGRLIYYYAHLDAYAPGLAEGQPVSQRQVIGTVGTTGNADPAAPHLHFAVHQTDPSRKWHEASVALNPYPLMGGRTKASPPR